MLLVNDVFPGPTIRADAGDIIKVTLINESPQSVSLHFHGLDMLGQPYSDGTSSVNQCAAGPLETIEYEFNVYNVGTHYWHGRKILYLSAQIITYNGSQYLLISCFASPHDFKFT
jgi:L-ascorbate oxidase